jgi:hypothetical protein
MVKLTNAIVQRWPVGRPLEYVHAPLAAGQDPPPLDESFYQPLAQRRLSAEARFVAGFLHENRSMDELRRILATIDVRIGQPVDVAASYGWVDAGLPRPT